VFIYIRIQAHAYIDNIYIYIYIYIRTITYIYVYKHTHTQIIYMHTCTHTYICTYTYICTHTTFCTGNLGGPPLPQGKFSIFSMDVFSDSFCRIFFLCKNKKITLTFCATPFVKWKTVRCVCVCVVCVCVYACIYIYTYIHIYIYTYIRRPLCSWTLLVTPFGGGNSQWSRARTHTHTHTHTPFVRVLPKLSNRTVCQNFWKVSVDAYSPQTITRALTCIFFFTWMSSRIPPPLLSFACLPRYVCVCVCVCVSFACEGTCLCVRMCRGVCSRALCMYV
jgi:hypothetical protein